MSRKEKCGKVETCRVCGKVDDRWNMEWLWLDKKKYGDDRGWVCIGCGDARTAYACGFSSEKKGW